MLKQVLLALVLLAPAGPALAQSKCPPPLVKVLRDNQEIPATGAALAPKVTLQVSPSRECTDLVNYQFTSAELTLMRGRRPVLPTLRVTQPEVNLTPFLRAHQPGDRIHVYIPYTSLVIVDAEGKKRPYPQPAPAKRNQPDLRTEAAQGISFTWPLMKL